MAQEMSGLLIDSSTNIVLQGPYYTYESPRPGLYPPNGGDQTSNVVITGDSSGIVFRNMPVGPGSGECKRKPLDQSINFSVFKLSAHLTHYICMSAIFDYELETQQVLCTKSIVFDVKHRQHGMFHAVSWCV